MMNGRTMSMVLVLVAVVLAATSARAANETGNGAATEQVSGQEDKTKAAPSAAESGQSRMGLLVFVFVLAIFLGFELISKVPSQLHTPLMSGSNAISGITIVGALLAAGEGDHPMTIALGVVAVTFAMINVVGGYLVTDRMLGMFKHKN